MDESILKILVCPITKTTLEYNAAAQELISHKASLSFPIRNGVPILLIEEARNVNEKKTSD